MRTNLIPFKSLKIVNQSEKDRNLEILSEFMDHGQFIGGKEIDSFEENIASFLQIDHALGVSSGTNALYLALKCFDLSEGDEVIVPSISWIATALVPKELGLTLVFADILDNLTIDPSSVEKLISKNTKVIISVDYMGQPADIKKLKSFNIPIIEDSSQAFGTLIDGQYCGTRGDIGCISLNPMKQLGALGDAGIIITNNQSYHQRLKTLRYCGMLDRETNIESSLNFRIDAIQAAFLNNKLTHFHNLKKQRYELYLSYVSKLPTHISTLKLEEDFSPYGFVIFVEKRDELMTFLSDRNIETQVQHRPLICDHKIFSDCRKDVENSSRLLGKMLSLPFYGELSEDDLDTIVNNIREFYAS
ncbi:MAG: aminotransferase class V-fold PLP-dependent enzyme [Bacteriovoracaceae bacterium]|nr:aminotransferase class V-fold PLP-dependent enzyme [Bacteriovoracaceae bacterium]